MGHPPRQSHHHHDLHQVSVLPVANTRKYCHEYRWNHMYLITKEEILVLMLLSVCCPAPLQKASTRVLILVRVSRTAE